MWPTWHPPRDPRYGCAFGHEHGSNPRAFRYFGRTGMPAFGLVSDYAGSPEAHAGFKVFVANEDRKGLAWMMVLHQGSASPRRGVVRFHSLETWLFRERGRRLLARTRQMADFGEAVPNCPGVRTRQSWRLLPVPACGRAYEEWATALDVGGVFGARPAFGAPQRDHPVRPGGPRARRLQQAVRLRGRPTRPAGSRAARATAARSATRAGSSATAGPSRFRTDAYGRRAPTGLLQIVARRIRVDQRRERDGVENAFIAEQPSDGGIYRAGRGFRPRRASSSPATASCARTDLGCPGAADPSRAQAGHAGGARHRPPPPRAGAAGPPVPRRSTWSRASTARRRSTGARRASRATSTGASSTCSARRPTP